MSYIRGENDFPFFYEEWESDLRRLYLVVTNTVAPWPCSLTWPAWISTTVNPWIGGCVSLPNHER